MNLFDFNIPEQILVALSLLILIIVLRRFFWKPVIKIIEDRQKNVEVMLKAAEEAKAQVVQMEEMTQHQRHELEQMIADKTNQARMSAQDEQERIISDAKKKACEIITSAEQRSKREYEQAIADSKKDITSLALSAASAVISSSMDSDTNRALIDSILSKQGDQNAN